MRSPRLLALVAAGLALLGAGLSGHLREGNERYAEGDFRGALEAYSKALAADPGSPEARYNLGGALYKLQDPEKALFEYATAATTLEQAAGGPTGLSLDATYNAANAAFALEKYREAATLYTRVLLESPDDRDAKHNLEMALRKLQQEQEDQKDDQPQDQQEEQQQQDQEQDQQQQGEGEEDQQEQQQDQQSGQEEDQEQPPEGGQGDSRQPPGEDQERQAPPSAEEISQEQVRRLLEELQRQEADAFKEAAQERILEEGSGRVAAQDW